MGAVGGVGAMQMTAQNVYINAANVMSGGIPGMPMGPSPLDLMGPKAAQTGLLARFGATRVGGALSSFGASIAGSRAGQFASSGLSMFGKVGGFASKGLGALGGGVPILGGVISGLNASANGKNVGQSIGNGIGTAAGTAIGAGLLSWIPVAGPLLGGTLGAALGGAIGEAIGGAINGAVNPAVKKVQDSIAPLTSGYPYTSGDPSGKTGAWNPYGVPGGTQAITVNLTLDGKKIASYINQDLGGKVAKGSGRTQPSAR
jgi:hypothetical protein